MKLDSAGSVSGGYLSVPLVGETVVSTCSLRTERVLVLQSKLNCEVLLDELAFEVRWAIAGDSIVVQLVAKIGNYHILSSLSATSSQ